MRNDAAQLVTALEIDHPCRAGIRPRVGVLVVGLVVLKHGVLIGSQWDRAMPARVASRIRPLDGASRVLKNVRIPSLPSFSTACGLDSSSCIRDGDAE